MSLYSRVRNTASLPDNYSSEKGTQYGGTDEEYNQGCVVGVVRAPRISKKVQTYEFQSMI